MVGIATVEDIMDGDEDPQALTDGVGLFNRPEPWGPAEHPRLATPQPLKRLPGGAQAGIAGGRAARYSIPMRQPSSSIDTPTASTYRNTHASAPDLKIVFE